MAPNTSLFVEVDVGSKSKNPLNVPPENAAVNDFSTMLRDAGIGNAESREILRRLKEKRIRLAQVNSQRHERFLVLFDITRTENDLDDLQSPSRRTAYL